MTDNCTNVRQTENLITSVQIQNVSLQRNKLKYKQNAKREHNLPQSQNNYFQTERQNNVHDSAEHVGLV